MEGFVGNSRVDVRSENAMVRWKSPSRDSEDTALISSIALLFQGPSDSCYLVPKKRREVLGTLLDQKTRCSMTNHRGRIEGFQSLQHILNPCSEC